MPYMLSQISVEGFDKWKAVFDEYGATRGAMGSRGGFVLRNPENPNQVTVLLEWDKVENARAYGASDELREAMQRAGVILKGPPNVFSLEVVDRPAA